MRCLAKVCTRNDTVSLSFYHHVTREITWCQNLPDSCKDLQPRPWRCVRGQTASLPHLGIEMDHYVLGFQNASYFYLRLYYDYKYLIKSDIADFLCGLFNRWDDDQSRSFLIGNGCLVFFLPFLCHHEHLY